jgi:putative transposase
LGVDVGISHGITRSDGYLGKNLGKIIKKEKKSQSERQRQKHKKKNFKTLVKQVLDHEIYLALRRSEKDGSNLVLEDPKVLANLKTGKLDGWARCYYANRSITKARELGVFIIKVHPAYTSITCSSCGHLDKHSRVNQSNFVCTGCGNMVNADLNAAINIARKGQERLIQISRLTDKVPVNTIPK